MFQDSDTRFYLHFQDFSLIFFFVYFSSQGKYYFLLSQFFLLSVPLSVERTISYAAGTRTSLVITLWRIGITTLCWLSSSPQASIICIQRRQQPRIELPVHRSLFQLPGCQLLPLNDIGLHVQEVPYHLQPRNVLNTLRHLYWCQITNNYVHIGS